MKLKIMVFFFIIPFLSFAQKDDLIKQNDTPKKNGIGFHFSYGDGLGIGLRYTRQLGNAGIAKFEFSKASRFSYVGRVGYEFLQIRKNKFEVGMGLDLRYSYNDYSEFGQSNTEELALELPIEFRYYLSPNFSLYTGLSFSKRLSTVKFENSDNTISEFRLGLKHHF